MSARIYELKDHGWPIRCKIKELENGKRIGEYSMEPNTIWWPSHSIAEKYAMKTEEIKSQQLEMRT